jgi:hypothetical protein
MVYGKAKTGGAKKSNFKTCPGCPSPAKCKAMGKCMKKEMARKK